MDPEHAEAYWRLELARFDLVDRGIANASASDSLTIAEVEPNDIAIIRRFSRKLTNEYDSKVGALISQLVGPASRSRLRSTMPPLADWVITRAGDQLGAEAIIVQQVRSAYELLKRTKPGEGCYVIPATIKLTKPPIAPFADPRQLHETHLFFVKAGDHDGALFPAYVPRD